MKKLSSTENGLALIFILALTGLIFAPPIIQNQDYHHFADRRMMLGIHNAMNVFSNISFLIGGWFGISLIRANKFIAAYCGQENIHIGIAIGTMLVGVGSSIYHYQPNDVTLVLDRLPMGFTFGLLLIDILKMYVWPDRNVHPAWFWGVAIMGAASVLFWYFLGSLKPYVLFQFFPMLALPYILVRNKKARTAGLIGLMVFYGLAKAMELGDDWVLHVSAGAISGHTIKHLLAGLAAWWYFSDREI